MDENKMPEETAENPAEESEEKPEKNAIADIYSLMHDLIYILAAITVVFVFFMRIVRVDGSSMVPTLEHKDYIALQSNVIMGELETGDIIVARKQSFREGEPIVKRVIATEGDTVDISYDADGVGTVYVNGVALEETYINEPMSAPHYDQLSFPLTVADNCVFVMGDNRNHSADSRYVQIGQINRSQILGKVLAVLLPGTGEDGQARDYGRIGAVS